MHNRAVLIRLPEGDDTWCPDCAADLAKFLKSAGNYRTPSTEYCERCGDKLSAEVVKEEPLDQPHKAHIIGYGATLCGVCESCMDDFKQLFY